MAKLHIYFQSPTSFLRFQRKTFCRSKESSYFCNVSVRDARSPRSNYIVEKRHYRFVFGDLNYHFKSKSKTNAESGADGCVYKRNRSVPRVRVTLKHTFRVHHILTNVGINSARSIWKAVVGRSHGTSKCGYPVFS